MMADHPEITPEELARAAEVFQATGSFTKAAAAIGRNRWAVTCALRSASNDSVRQRVYARTLDSVLSSGVAAQRHAVKVLRADLDNSDPKVAHSASAQINDTMRAAATARTAIAKLTGDHAPDKHEVRVDAVDEISRRIARLADPGEAG
jgi:hypothetical protein